ncbi:MAG: hypothetical protein AB7S26_16060 [Sandaracinaceae bacterium]
MRPLVSATLVLGALAVPAGAARAQDPLAEGIADYERGALEDALAAFGRVESGDRLDRDGVVRLLTYRMLVCHALDDDACIDRAALGLLSLRPEGPAQPVSPPIAAALDAARERGGGRLRVGFGRGRIRVEGDVAGLVRSLDVRARRGAGSWLRGDAARALIAERHDDTFVLAHAIGPGGAVLASLGSDDEPHALRPLSRSLAPAVDGDVAREDDIATPPGRSAEPNDDTGLHVGLVIGAVVLVATAIAVGTALAVDGQGGTRVGAIAIEW